MSSQFKRTTACWLPVLFFAACFARAQTAQPDSLLADLTRLPLYQYGETDDPRARICAALRDADPSARGLIVDALIECLGSGNSVAARDFSVRQLGIYATADQLPQLSALLENEAAVESAAHVLASLPFPEVDSLLVAALPRVAPSQTHHVIGALADRRSPGTASALVPFLRATNDTTVHATVDALINVGGEVAWTALTMSYPEVSEDLRARIDRAAVVAARTAPGGMTLFSPKTVKQARAAAFRVLPAQELDETIRSAAREEDWEVLDAATLALNDVSCEPCMDGLVADFAQLPAHIRIHLLGVLRAHRYEPGLNVLMSALEDEDATVRCAALTSLDGWGNDEFILPLANIANEKSADRNSTEAGLARVALVGLAGDDVDETLLALLDTQEAPIQAQLLFALSVRNVHESIPALLAFAKEDNPVFWREAFTGLSRLAGSEQLDALFDMLRNEVDPQRRNQEIFALRSVLARADSNSTRLAALERALISSEQPEARQAIYQLVASICGADGLPLLLHGFDTESGETHTSVVRALASLPPDLVVQPLFRLATENRGTRPGGYALEGALQALGRLSDTLDTATLVDYLLQARALCDEPWQYKRLFGAFGRIGRMECLPLIVDFLGQPEIAAEAARAVHDIIFFEATISAVDDAQAQAGNMIDGDMLSAWSVAVLPNQTVWVELDMGREVVFKEVEIDSTPAGNLVPPRLRVYTAREPNGWGDPVAEVNGQPLLKVPLGDRTGRYLRIEVPASPEQVLWVVHEIRFLGNNGTTLGVMPVEAEVQKDAT